MLCLVAGTLAGAAWAGIAGHPQGDRRRARGDLDDHAQLDRVLGRARTCSARAGRCRARSRRSRSRTTSPKARSCRSSGGSRCCRASRSGSSSRSRCSSSTGSSSTARRSASRCARSGSTRRRRATAASPSRATTSSRWRSRARSPGLAGALDITGWEYRIGENDIQASTIGFIGLAAALLGRNTALGVGVASLLFGALINGTSGRQLDPSIFRPDLAGNLTTIIQGLVILFVGLNLGGIGVWLKKRRKPA